MGPQNLPAVLQEVRGRMARAAAAAGRNAQSVTLLAVGKGQPVELLAAAAECGLTDFGENYLQEALAKVAALQNRALTWHFIGRLQANKTRPIAETFAWVHTLDRPRVAERLGAQRPFHAPALNVCLQVNISGEASKSGASPEELPALAQAVAALPNLRLRGLMAIPEPQDDPELQRLPFARLRELAQAIVKSGIHLDTLSMGMSGDMRAAVLEGATIVRVGSAIFGARHYE